MYRRIAGPALSAVLLGLTVAAAAAQRAPPRDTAAARVHGVVLDLESREPVAGALIELTRVEADTAPDSATRTRTTADDGRFDFDDIEPGAYRLVIQRIGYRSLTREVDVTGGTETQIAAEIASDAVGLDPVLVTATRPLAAAGPALTADLPFGTRIGRDEIEARRAPRLSDLLRSVPGIRFQHDEAAAELRVTLRSGCTPAIFLDGLETFSIQHLDATLMPRDLQAVDVFRGAETPAAFRSNSCGAILLHTRGRQLDEGSGPFWKRLAAGIAFFTGIFLLLR